jgi:hypothetical protein
MVTTGLLAVFADASKNEEKQTRSEGQLKAF